MTRRVYYGLYILQLFLFMWMMVEFSNPDSTIMNRLSYQLDITNWDSFVSRSLKLHESFPMRFDEMGTNPNIYSHGMRISNVPVSDNITITIGIGISNDSTSMGITPISYQLGHENYAYNHGFNRIDWSGSIFWQNAAYSKFEHSILSDFAYKSNHSRLINNLLYFQYALLQLAIIGTCLLPITTILFIRLAIKSKGEEKL